jgi:hypothetical protein
VTPRAAPSGWLLFLGLLGAAATVLALASTVDGLAGLRIGLEIGIPPPARALLVGCLLALGLAVALAPPTTSRRELLVAGLAALGALAVLVAVPDTFATAAVVLLLGAGHATRPARRPFAARMRGPALAALLLGLGWFFVRTGGTLGRVGALGLALGLVAAAGLLPYLAELEPEEATSSSSLVWTAFFAPALALSLLPRVLTTLTPGEASVFAATLIALGLLNLGWGGLAAWRIEGDAQAWRYSFVAEWGIALTGMGLILRDGRAAAYLALLALVLVRLPLYLRARPALLQRIPGRLAPVNVLVGLLLAGVAPFSGFPVRLLALRAATQLWWPVALLLLAMLLLYMASSFRLARSLGHPKGREALGLYVVLAASLALGLAPGLFLAAGGF